ncbi:MAG: hypothetical protein KDE27_31015 [Planctomycetes bacterium]|nr:hypothetical protein [Planctomycetota bacterium]
MTRQSPSAPDGANFEDAFERRLESLASTELPDAELAALPPAARQALLNDELTALGVTDTVLTRIATRTRSEMRALRASRRLGAQMLGLLQDVAADALAWCDQLFAQLRPRHVAVWHDDAAVAIVVEHGDEAEQTFHGSLLVPPCRTRQGTLRVDLQAPIANLSGWQRARAMVFLGASDEPAEWRASYIAEPELAEATGSNARLTFDFPLTGKAEGATEEPSYVIAPGAIRQIRVFVLPD